MVKSVLTGGSVVADDALEVSENSEKLEKAVGVNMVTDDAAEAVMPADEAVTF